MAHRSTSSALEAVLKRDRWIVLSGLAGVSALAWCYLLLLAAGMPEMSQNPAAVLAPVQLRAWDALDFVLMFLMWVVMMVAMMLPSAAPMILLFASFNRKQNEQGRPFVPTSVFVAGYLIVWVGFSLGATLVQWALDQAALLSPMMVSSSPVLGGILLVAAGVFQWTPLKNACLEHCRSPFEFLRTGWRKGARGALQMGLGHGAYCLGCCWILMGLLFFGGVMNLLWIATIAIFVLIEKAVPRGAGIGRVTGLLLVVAGVVVASR